MPTYEYVCDACGNQLEEFQSFSDKPLKKCPKCKKSKLRRLFGTGAALIFKGSGFYQTDYRSESYKAGAKADAPPPAAESKPASDSSAAPAKSESKTPKSSGGKSEK
ncbi:MAG: zinc ribbon domain-containing protein [Planctomycetota bacterium]